MTTTKFCTECGNNINPDAHFCTQCGAKSVSVDEPIAMGINTEIISPKSASTALLLCMFLGALGIHRFYLGKIGTGILMLFTGGGLGIWVLIDLVKIACCEFTDKAGRSLVFVKGRTSSTKVIWILCGFFVSVIALVALIISLAFYATSGVADVVNNQLTALRSGDFEKAYSYTAKDFQKSISFERFKTFIEQHPTLKNSQSSTFSERRIENNDGTFKGTLKASDDSLTMIEYHLIKEDGAWKILEIKLPLAERANETNQTSKVVVPVPNVYEDKDNQYSINYPADWGHEQTNKTTVMFSGKQGTASSTSVVAIQTVPSKKAGGAYKSIKIALGSLKKQIASKATDVKFVGEGSIELPRNPKKFRGSYFIVNFTLKEKQYKKMQVILESNDGKKIYSWGYAAPMDVFLTNLPIAKAMYESWNIE